MTKGLEKEVAIAVRVEHNTDNDDVFLVFQIVDESFKNKIKEDWTQDIEMRLINKTLVIKE